MTASTTPPSPPSVPCSSAAKSPATARQREVGASNGRKEATASGNVAAKQRSAVRAVTSAADVEYPPCWLHRCTPPVLATTSPTLGLDSLLLWLWPRHRCVGGGADASVEEARGRRWWCTVVVEEGRKCNWVLQILRVQSLSADDTGSSGKDSVVADAGEGGEGSKQCMGFDASRAGHSCPPLGAGADREEGCLVHEAEEFDWVGFSRFMRKVSLAEAKLYFKMTYLCKFAYMVPRIKPKYLQKYNMKFVTSSFRQERAKVPNSGDQEDQKLHDRKNQNTGKKSTAFKDQELACVAITHENQSGQGINPFAAYHVAASPASYLQSRAMEVLPFSSQVEVKSLQAIVNGVHTGGLSMEEASFVATTNSVTSMVAAKEEMKQAVADDLNSSRTCPCEWFVCDDSLNSTRYFVVQGSETIASWQANLLFEPIKFEGFDVVVHRGIYEAVKGIYQQILPYVKSHLRSHGKCARLQFTGHSIGGSFALLVPDRPRPSFWPLASCFVSKSPSILWSLSEPAGFSWDQGASGLTKLIDVDITKKIIHVLPKDKLAKTLLPQIKMLVQQAKEQKEKKTGDKQESSTSSKKAQEQESSSSEASSSSDEEEESDYEAEDEDDDQTSSSNSSHDEEIKQLVKGVNKLLKKLNSKGVPWNNWFTTTLGT
ncbi:uncharacterized protein [Setaria viridis]|uniref:uncharacterized protein n=1 Tax=Setaria viridis TaxID=4556 RepID=UPI003B3B7100